jgi:hypothetical protein
VAPFPAKQSRSETNRESFDANAKEFGDNEVAEFVKNHRGSEDEDESQRYD